MNTENTYIGSPSNIKSSYNTNASLSNTKKKVLPTTSSTTTNHSYQYQPHRSVKRGQNWDEWKNKLLIRSENRIRQHRSVINSNIRNRMVNVGQVIQEIIAEEANNNQHQQHQQHTILSSVSPSSSTVNSLLSSSGRSSQEPFQSYINTNIDSYNMDDTMNEELEDTNNDNNLSNLYTDQDYIDFLIRMEQILTEEKYTKDIDDDEYENEENHQAQSYSPNTMEAIRQYEYIQEQENLELCYYVQCCEELETIATTTNTNNNDNNTTTTLLASSSSSSSIPNNNKNDYYQNNYSSLSSLSSDINN